MKSKCIILGIFLLIPFILKSQDGSTIYPLTEFQLRQLGAVKRQYNYLLWENDTLKKMMILCDSIIGVDDTVFEAKDEQIALQVRQLVNRQETILEWENKYMLSEEQIKKERRKKSLYFGTTLGAVVLLVISLFGG